MQWVLYLFEILSLLRFCIYWWHIFGDCTFVYLDSSYVYDHCTLIYDSAFVVPESCFLFCCLCQLLILLSLSIQVKSVNLLSGIEEKVFFLVREIMSTQRTRANPNSRRTASIQPPCVSIPNEDTPQPAIGTPSSATTTTQVNAMAANFPLAATSRSSGLVLTQMDTQPLKNLGETKISKTSSRTYSLKHSQEKETISPRSLKNGSCLWMITLPL